MQGWDKFIPTEEKIRYINSLLRVGFDTVDFGSFVSPKAVPQMADTREVVSKLETSQSVSKLLAIVANTRGAEEASTFPQITYIGFPFSVSETFQHRNTNSSITESLDRVGEIHEICTGSGKQLVVYISMGFGNPYGDPFNQEIVFGWVEKLVAMGIGIISLADTVGLAAPEQVFDMAGYLIASLPHTEIGVHLHSRADNWREKIEAAYRAGCRRFDGALNGIGGCPMAGDALVGNMNTEWTIGYFEEMGVETGLDKSALSASSSLAREIFV